MLTHTPSGDDAEYVKARLLLRFKHQDMDDPFVRALFDEALRRQLGLPRERP